MASRADFHKVARRRTTGFLLGATLLTSAVHFVDNAFRLDLYPGPVWLTRNDVLLAWLALPALAWLVYCGATRVGLVTYGLLGFAGLAHYLGASPSGHSVALCGDDFWGGDCFCGIDRLRLVSRFFRTAAQGFRPPLNR
jgi:hypothetical protein